MNDRGCRRSRERTQLRVKNELKGFSTSKLTPSDRRISHLNLNILNQKTSSSRFPLLPNSGRGWGHPAFTQ